MRVKVLETPPGLCARCHHGVVVERATGRTRTICNWFVESVEMPPDVARCTKFADRSMAQLHDLREVAWTLRTDTSGRVMGFVAPKKEDDR